MLEVKKAAAGSGKTFLLTQEYLKLLLGFVDTKDNHILYYTKQTAKAQLETHRKILAITFTNKATEEMKQRIVKELYILSSGEESQHLEVLCKYYNVDEETIRKAAEKALSELLFDFSRFNISTIDSFFQTILRTFTREANIGAEYGVELREDSIIKVSTTDLIHSLRINGRKENSKLRNWLKQYIISKIDDFKNWNIFSDSDHYPSNDESLYSIAKELGKENFKKHKEEFLKFLDTENGIKDFKDTIDNKIRESKELKAANAIDFGNYVSDNIGNDAIKGAIKNFIIKVQNAQGNYDGIDLSLTDSFINSYSDPDKWIKKGITIDEHTAAILAEHLNNIVTAEKFEKTLNLMGKNMYAIGLLGDISKNLQKYREENDVILLSDTNEYLKRIIGTDDTPFIYERVGLSLKHFLIDEFQDTSKLQMSNITPLLTESLSHKNYNLIIGDEKQSIYRFRNADPSLLQTQIFKDFKDFITEDSFKVQKSTNWRSEENIIKFNNTLFHNLIEIISENYDSKIIRKTYNNVIQSVSPKRKHGKGYINIKFFDNPDDDNSYDDVPKWHKNSIDTTLSLIHDMVDRGYCQSDIAILVFSNDEGSEIINAILQDNEKGGNGNKLNVISDESLLLCNSPTINLIISIIEYLDCTILTKKEENKGQRDILRILQTYQKLLAQNEKSPSEALKIALEQNSELISEEDLNKMVEGVTLTSSSLFTVIETIINNFVSEESLSNEAPFIYAFQDVVLEYSSHNTPTIHEFIKWWHLNGNSISITSPTNIDAIKVMTIHKSKGLEFPYVIIPFANWPISKFRGLLWLDTPEAIKETLDCPTPPIIPVTYSTSISKTFFEDQFNSIIVDMIIDNLNKTYVALTRASREMHIFAPNEPEKKSGNTKNTKFNSYLKSALTYFKNENPDDTLNFEKGMIDENNFVFGQPDDNPRKKENNSSGFIEVNKYIPGKSMGKFSFTLPDFDDEPDAIEKGNIYHNIMSNITNRDSLYFAIEKSVAKHLVKQEDKDQIRNLFSKWINMPETKEWFDDKYQVINERPMQIGTEIYRADRIIIDKKTNEATVIDYKFGKVHKKQYAKSVAKYMEILEKTGYKNVKGFIWYPFEECIEKV